MQEKAKVQWLLVDRDRVCRTGRNPVARSGRTGIAIVVAQRAIGTEQFHQAVTILTRELPVEQALLRALGKQLRDISSRFIETESTQFQPSHQAGHTGPDDDHPLPRPISPGRGCGGGPDAASALESMPRADMTAWAAPCPATAVTCAKCRLLIVISASYLEIFIVKKASATRPHLS